MWVMHSGNESMARGGIGFDDPLRIGAVRFEGAGAKGGIPWLGANCRKGG
jgi:hypothetical protein